MLRDEQRDSRANDHDDDPNGEKTRAIARTAGGALATLPLDLEIEQLQELFWRRSGEIGCLRGFHFSIRCLALPPRKKLISRLSRYSSAFSRSTDSSRRFSM